MAAVFRVDLCKAEHFAVGELAPELSFDFVEVFNLFGREGKAFALVVFLYVFDVFYRGGLDVGREYFLVEVVVHPLQHGVVFGVFVGYGEILLYARNAFKAHVLCDFHRVGAPRGYHLASRANKVSFERCGFQFFCTAVQPAKFIYFVGAEVVVCCSCNDVTLRGFEKDYHIVFRVLLRYNVLIPCKVNLFAP